MMPKKCDPIPYLLLIAGIVGLLAIVVASNDAFYGTKAVADPSSPPPELTTPTPLSTSQTAESPTATTTLQPTVATPSTPASTATPTRAPTPTSTATPTSTPFAISPPVVSSTGALAYVEAATLIVVKPDGSEATMISGGITHGAQALAWSPDGRRLFYAAQADPPGAGSATERQTFHIWDSQPGETHHPGRGGPGFESGGSTVDEAIWSPQGTRILLRDTSDASSPAPWVLDVATTHAWHLPEASIISATWLDEDTILCQKSEEDVFRLWNVGPPPQALTETIALNGPYALSPDRDYIASFKGKAGEGQRLHILPLPSQAQDGSESSGKAPRLALSHQPTVTVSGRDPLWSPDGRWVAYEVEAVTSYNANGTFAPPHVRRTLVADTLGVSATQSFPHLRPIAWSPDGRLLAGFGCSDSTCSLSLVDAVSGRAASIVSARDLHLWDLAWSPGGVYLAYGVSGADEEGLMLWDRATGEHHRLMQPGERGEAQRLQPLTDLQWDADGCGLYAAQREKKGSDLSVSAIWGIGPSWEDRWLVAPGFLYDPPASAERVERADVNHERDRPQNGRLTPSCPDPLLDDRRLIAYYGTPLGPGLGILGRHGITETLRLLQEQAQIYRDLDPSVDTVPAFHMVTTIADSFPGPDADYNHRVAHTTIRRWIEGVEAEGGWSILDLQPGRADVIDELDAIEPLLLEPTVHLAVDPEFIVTGDQVPGEDLGQITGPQINRVQARLDQVAREIGQRKMLVIHQFNDRMMEQKEMILHYPLVDLVWDADGFGSPGPKIEDYDQYKMETGFEYGGFKIFYVYDEPLVTPEQVLSLDPPPRLVIYQ